MSIKLFILLMFISVCIGIINPLVLHTIGMLASKIKHRLLNKNKSRINFVRKYKALRVIGEKFPKIP